MQITKEVEAAAARYLHSTGVHSSYSLMALTDNRIALSETLRLYVGLEVLVWADGVTSFKVVDESLYWRWLQSGTRCEIEADAAQNLYVEHGVTTLVLQLMATKGAKISKGVHYDGVSYLPYVGPTQEKVECLLFQGSGNIYPFEFSYPPKSGVVIRPSSLPQWGECAGADHGTMRVSLTGKPISMTSPLAMQMLLHFYAVRERFIEAPVSCWPPAQRAIVESFKDRGLIFERAHEDFGTTDKGSLVVETLKATMKEVMRNV